MLDPAIELVLIQNRVQPIVEGVARSPHHIAGCDPQLLLPFSLLAGAHRHKQFYGEMFYLQRTLFDYYHGLLEAFQKSLENRALPLRYPRKLISIAPHTDIKYQNTAQVNCRYPSES